MDKVEKSRQIHRDVQSLESTLIQLSVQQKILKGKHNDTYI